ncbi:hypothetical protein [Dysgonomonas reticulitermitis]
MTTSFPIIPSASVVIPVSDEDTHAVPFHLSTFPLAVPAGRLTVGVVVPLVTV